VSEQERPVKPTPSLNSIPSSTKFFICTSYVASTFVPIFKHHGGHRAVRSFAVRQESHSSRFFGLPAAEAALFAYSESGIALVAADTGLHVALIAITAYVAHFGIEARAGYGLAARVELLISSMVLALGVGTTTMVGTCVGAGLEARARRVTRVSCLLAAAIFAAIGLGVAFSGTSIAGLFTHAEAVVSAASGYFYATGLVYGFMAAFVILFSAYQGWGQATAPLLVSLSRVAIVLAGGWMLLQQQGPRLDWLYYLVAGSTVIGALTLGIVFAFRPPNRRSRALSG